MKLTRTWLGVVSVAVAVIATACGGSTGGGTNPADQTGTLTVWLMNGSAPASVIDSVNADFKAKYPKVDVKVEIQQWGDIGTKLDTASGGSNPPDVIELGQKLMAAHSSDPNSSALYYPGKYWYAALPFIWDFGGNIATQSGGQWQGSLNSDTSQQGLVKLQSLVSSLSRADKTGDEAKQDAAFAQGHIAMIIANGWEVGVITDPKAGNPALKDQLGAFPIPSHNAGQTAPVFLGGSDLAVAAGSK